MPIDGLSITATAKRIYCGSYLPAGESTAQQPGPELPLIVAFGKLAAMS
jgi:hypothetical protein